MTPVGRWPDYLIQRACRPPPGSSVVPGSTPVVSFGDPVKPMVATLGINPSSREFLSGDGVLLTGAQRRLATLDSLGISDHQELHAAMGAVIVDDCARYFERRPYRRWFDPLDRLLRAGAGASYFDGTACHLDLVQWATSPVWGGLPESARAQLLIEDEPFLVRQLRQEHYRLVVVNGRTVMDWTGRAGLVSWEWIGTVPGPPPAELYVGEGVGPTFVAWSSNIQSQPGAARHAEVLAALIAEHAPTIGKAEREARMPHLSQGTRLDSISALVDALADWLDRSDADRLGDISNYGGRPWLAVETPLGRMHLNADTRRDAIASFVGAARSGRDLRMHVTANRAGRLNKVVFDGCQQEGWYAYLYQPLPVADSRTVLGTGTGTVQSAGTLAAPAPRQAAATAHPNPPQAADEVSMAENGGASIVQFNHPGGEHVPHGDLMPWNTGDSHKRKFLVSHGSIVDADGTVTFEGPLVFWGEWEPPSTIAHRWEPQPALPTVLHVPCWDSPPPGPRQNTDPWVFGSEFLYSNCKQRNPSGTPSALQHLAPGSLVLFGSARHPEFVIDTVFVVADAVTQYRPIDGISYGTDAFKICTVESLTTEPRPRATTYTLIRGATPRHPVNGAFSFVPCLRRTTEEPRFLRPAIELPGIINPRSRQSASGANHLRPRTDVVAAWRSVVQQVLAANLELGVNIAEPPRGTGRTATLDG